MKAVVTGLALVENKGKDKREAESWKVRWPLPPADDAPSDKDAEALKVEWGNGMAKDKVTSISLESLASRFTTFLNQTLFSFFFFFICYIFI